MADGLVTLVNSDLPLETTVLPVFMLHLLGLFVPAVKELIEMRYQRHVPFVLDDSKFRAAFGATATSLEVGVRETARWMAAGKTNARVSAAQRSQA